MILRMTIEVTINPFKWESGLYPDSDLYMIKFTQYSRSDLCEIHKWIIENYGEEHEDMIDMGDWTLYIFPYLEDVMAIKLRWDR